MLSMLAAILAQLFHPEMYPIKHRRNSNTGNRIFRKVVFTTVCICLWSILLSCSSKPVDLRTLAPADSLIYLESNDLAAAIQPIVDSDAFNRAAASKPDLSALKGVQLAIAVTGFETAEKQVTDEASVLSFRPHFVAIADTHAWNWQAKTFTENQLGEFVNKIYGGGIQLDTDSKNGGTNYVWTAEDGRKAYAFVIDSLVYFGNDQSSIEKCIAVRKGEADAFAKSGKAPNAGGNLAIGYISPEGVAQLSNIIGTTQAKESGEEAEVQSFVARILPQILRGAISEASWTASNGEQGVEDKVTLTTNADVTSVLSETLAPGDANDKSPLEFIPNNVPSATRYNLKNPQIAWRSVLLTTQKLTDTTTGNILTQFSGSFFEPYAVRDPEGFLGSVGNDILTAKFDEEGEKPVVIATVKDADKLKKSLLPELKPDKQKSDELAAEILTSPNGDAAAFVENKMIAGDAESVFKCLQAKKSGDNLAKTTAAQQLAASKAPAATVALDTQTAPALAAVLSEKKAGDTNTASRYFTETRYTKNGIDRRVVSDFGIIGSIIAELAEDEQ